MQTAEDIDIPGTIYNSRLMRLQWLYGVPTIVIPHLALLFVIAQSVRGAATRWDIGMLVVSYTLTMTGITVGFHRQLTHKAFRSGNAVKVLFAILGSATAQGPVVMWVGNHRRHHRYSERRGDPHSPFFASDGSPQAGLRGFWHAHVGWLFTGEFTNAGEFCRDLLRDKALMWVNDTYLVWMALGLILPSAVGYWHAGLHGALNGLLWGGLARMALNQNAVWSIGSLAHIIGSRDFKTVDESKNSVLLAVPNLGEWHNNHHAFPSLANYGFRWWQLDPTGWIILGLEKLGLVWGVHHKPEWPVIRARLQQPIPAEDAQ